ncbi:MAG: DNA repair protein RecO [Gemmatimonadota bacterium]|nr:DNA repair protein RecO [Gemmatimonadota bacterium]
MAPVSTRAVLLRGYDYGDTSRILRFYTLDHGLLSVVARGVRGRSGKGGSAVSSFSSGDLVAYVKPYGDLHTMKDFSSERARPRIPLHVLRFAGAACLVELVLSHAEQEPQPMLFERLNEELDRLDAAVASELPPAILSALWRVTSVFGFEPELTACVHCGRSLGDDEVGRFDFEAGGLRCEACGHGPTGPRLGPIARGQVRALLEGSPPGALTHPRRHLALISDFVAHHVAQKPLKALRFLADRLPPDADEPS